jgi:5-amino-6-(5-phospho-D-ribitylamino)uracil phosphatase
LAVARLEAAARGSDDAAAPAPPPPPAPGTARLLHTLAAHSVPAALATAAPAARVLPALEAAGLGDAFATVVTADDVARGRPDPEAYLVAAARLGRPPTRCVLIGASNSAVEAAREAGMAAVAVAGGAGGAPRAPRYELAAADLVVPSLDTVTMADLRSLFAYEEPVEPLSSWSDDESGDRAPDDDDYGGGPGGGGAWGSLADEDGGLFGL